MTVVEDENKEQTSVRIHCHSQVDKSTLEYVKFMWDTMFSLASYPELLSLTVHCITQTAADRLTDWAKSRAPHVNTVSVNSITGGGSNAHGACVMSALKMTGDGDIHIICDSDTVVVAKGWDEYLRQRLVVDKVSIIGSAYEDVGGFSSGNKGVQTYKKIPTVTWCALSPLHDWRTLDVTPNKAHRVSINTKVLSETYNLPEGNAVFGEVGWTIPEYLRKYGLTCEAWRQRKASKDSIIIKNLSDYHEEFHVGNENDSIPFVVHHRGSMRHAYRSNKISALFYGAVDKYIATETTFEQRWKCGDKTYVGPPTPGQVQVINTAVEEPAKKTPDAPGGVEWIKLTFNSTVIAPRRAIDVNNARCNAAFEPPTAGSIGQMRIEGSIRREFALVVPAVTKAPYLITCRNITDGPIIVTCGKGAVVSVPVSKMLLLSVDVDGVFTVG